MLLVTFQLSVWQDACGEDMEEPYEEEHQSPCGTVSYQEEVKEDFWGARLWRGNRNHAFEHSASKLSWTYHCCLWYFLLGNKKLLWQLPAVTRVELCYYWGKSSKSVNAYLNFQTSLFGAFHRAFQPALYTRSRSTDSLVGANPVFYSETTFAVWCSQVFNFFPNVPGARIWGVSERTVIP